MYDFVCVTKVYFNISVYLWEWKKVIGQEQRYMIGRKRCSNKSRRSKPSPDRSVELYDLGRFSTQRRNWTSGRISTGPIGRCLTHPHPNSGWRFDRDRRSKVNPTIFYGERSGPSSRQSKLDRQRVLLGLHTTLFTTVIARSSGTCQRQARGSPGSLLFYREGRGTTCPALATAPR